MPTPSFVSELLGQHGVATLFWVCSGVIVMAQLGYPLLLRLWAKLAATPDAPRAPRPDVELPSVSLVIAACNEEVVLEEKLGNSLQIDYPREKLEVILASDGSRDRTVEIARRYVDRGIRLLDFPVNRGKATTLNEAIGQTRGELLFLCDANVMFRPEALRILVERLRDPAVGAATGDVRLLSSQSEFGEGESLYYRIERQLQRDESAVGSTIGVDGGMYLIRRQLVQPLPADTILDDFVNSMRVLKQGYRVIYEPRAVALENGTELAADEFRRRTRMAAGAAQTLKRGEFPPPWQPRNFGMWFGHKFLRWISPACLVLALLTNLWLARGGLFFRATLAIQLLFHGVALLAWWSPKLRGAGWARIPYYFCLSHLALGRGLLRGLFLRQSGAWKRTTRQALTPTAAAPPVENDPAQMTPHK